YFELGSGAPGRLLLVIHHLAVDGVSWRVLLEDLLATYQQLRQGRAPLLPPKTTSFQQWATRLVDYARSDEVRREAAFWLAEPRRQVTPLPLDHDGGPNRFGSVATVDLSLSEEETGQLLREVPEVYRTQVNDVLLAALAE